MGTRCRSKRRKKNPHTGPGTYTRSKMEPGFQIVAGAYSSYVTRAIWKGIRSRFHFGMGIYPDKT